MGNWKFQIGGGKKRTSQKQNKKQLDAAEPEVQSKEHTQLLLVLLVLVSSLFH